MSINIKDMMSREEKLAFQAQERAKNLAERMKLEQQGKVPPLGVSTPQNTNSSSLNHQAHIAQVMPQALTIEQLQEELFKRKKELVEKVDNMVLDANSYRVNTATIRLLTEDKSPKERLNYAGNISIVTNVPIIVVVCYLGEMYGFSDELNEKLASLMSFYTVTEVLNVRK